MNISVTSSGTQTTSSQSSEATLAALQKQEQKLLAQIKKLQNEDAKKNEKEIQSLQQQAQQIEIQIQQQTQSQSQSSSGGQSAPAKPNVGPAYTVELSQKNKQINANSEGVIAETAGAEAVE